MYTSIKEFFITIQQTEQWFNLAKKKILKLREQKFREIRETLQLHVATKNSNVKDLIENKALLTKLFQKW